MAMTTRITTVRSSTARNINTNFAVSRSLSRAQRQISTMAAYKFKDKILPLSEYAVKQKGVDCDFCTDTYLKSHFSLPKENMQWYEHFYRGSHSHVKLKQVANRIEKGSDLVELNEQHGPLKLRFLGITQPGTRFDPSSFHCLVLKDVWQLPSGRLVGLFYDPEGLPNTSDVEKLIGFGDMKGIETEDDIDPDMRALLNKIKDQFVVHDLDEIARNSRVQDLAHDGVFAVDEENSTREEDSES